MSHDSGTLTDESNEHSEGDPNERNPGDPPSKKSAIMFNIQGEKRQTCVCDWGEGE